MGRTLNTQRNLRRSLVLGGFLVCFFVPNTASAMFTSDETSKDNLMQAGSIELAVTPGTADDEAIATEENESGIEYVGTVDNKGKSDFRYEITIKDDEEKSFCKSFTLTAERDHVQVYEGFLADFKYTSDEPVKSGESVFWEFYIGYPSDLEIGGDAAYCWDLFKFTAWQAKLDSPKKGGWTAEAGLSLEEASALKTFGAESLVHDEGVIPEETTPETTDETTTPPGDEETTPPSDETTPPADEPVTPPVTEETSESVTPEEEEVTEEPVVKEEPKEKEVKEEEKKTEESPPDEATETSDSSS